jgi:hypothetical protein
MKMFGFEIDVAQRVTEVVLPRIFEWYKDDFGNTKQVKPIFAS